MRGAADILVAQRRERPSERGGLVGKVEALLRESPGLTVREMVELHTPSHPEPDVWTPGPRLPVRVSGAVNKLKNEGKIAAQNEGSYPYRWAPIDRTAELDEASERRRGGHVDGWCSCGVSILFGPLATREERARPRCSAFPFARRGAA